LIWRTGAGHSRWDLGQPGVVHVRPLHADRDSLHPAGNLPRRGEDAKSRRATTPVKTSAAASGPLYLGIRAEPSTEDSQGKGLRIMEVLPDSPAARAGLRVGDVITTVGERKVEDRDALREVIHSSKADKDLSLKIRRGTAAETVKVRPTPRPQQDVTGTTTSQSAPDASAGDSRRLEQLEREVEKLRSRVHELEKKHASASAP